MLKRTIYIGNPSYLRLENSQLKIKCAESKKEKGSIPIEDIAVLLLDHGQITVTSQLLEKLMQHTVAMVNCDAKHLPNGLMLPLQGHSELTQRWRHQIEASQPLKKQLWKQTVQSKIRNQADLLGSQGHEIQTMRGYLDKVISGDETNMEGIAAQHYWKYLFKNFRRDREGGYPNNFLNFTYAILRSIVARAIVSSGMLPALGIFHKNKYNPYCLADDIMEPYRPFADKLVLEWKNQNHSVKELDKHAKAYLMSIATLDVEIDDLTRPLMVAVTTTTSSLQACLEGIKRQISYPRFNG